MPNAILPRHQPIAAPTIAHATVNQISGHHGTNTSMLWSNRQNAPGVPGSTPCNSLCSNESTSGVGARYRVVDAFQRDVTPGQVILRWHLQLGTLPIPKSATPSRQEQNLDLDGFELTDDEVAAISGLAREDGRWFGGDPETHEEM